MILQHEGRVGIFQNDQECWLDPEDMAIVDAARPSRFCFDGGYSGQISVHLPRAEMDQRFGRRFSGGIQIPKDQCANDHDRRESGRYDQGQLGHQMRRGSQADRVGSLLLFFRSQTWTACRLVVRSRRYPNGLDGIRKYVVLACSQRDASLWGCDLSGCRHREPRARSARVRCRCRHFL